MSKGQPDPAPQRPGTDDNFDIGGDLASVTGGGVDLAPPAAVRRIVRRLEEAGFESWAVGGAVRDALVGRRPTDWDLATAARPGEMRRLFRRTVPVGLEHGTVGVLGDDGRMYEVTTFRRDVETDGRHARVAFADRIEDDLARRDFTINAVAWHPLRREMRDPHGGVDDLHAGLLRTVGEPAERFREDRLRVLRALRFAGRFRLHIEAETWAALSRVTPDLGALSPERIRDELRKTLAEMARPSHTLRLYAAAGALAVWFPELQAAIGADPGPCGDLYDHLLAAADAAPRSRPLLRMAALFHRLGAAGRESDRPAEIAERSGNLARAILVRLRASNAQIDRIGHLVVRHATLPTPAAPPVEFRRWLQLTGLPYANDSLRLAIAVCRARGGSHRDLASSIRAVRTTRRERPALDIADLAIGGRELRGLGVQPGPRFGEILRILLERVIEDPDLNTPERLAALVVEIAGEQ